MDIEKNPRGPDRVVIELDMDKFRDMCNMNDFFEMSGTKKYLENGTIFDVRQMEMNNITMSKILEYWKKNWRKCKDVKGYKKKYAMSSIEFTWMNYAPVSSDDCPEDTIFLYPKKKNKDMSNFERWQVCCKQKGGKK